MAKNKEERPKGNGGNRRIHEHPNANTNGLDKNPQNINKDGRNRTLKAMFDKLQEEDSCIWLNTSFTGTERQFKAFASKTNFKHRIITKKNDTKAYFLGVQLSKPEAMMLRLDKILMNGSDATALKGFIFLWEQQVGKARTTIQLENTEDQTFSFDGLMSIVDTKPKSLSEKKVLSIIKYVIDVFEKPDLPVKFKDKLIRKLKSLTK